MPTLRPPNWSDFTEEEQAIFEEAAKRQGVAPERMIQTSIIGVQAHWPAWQEANRVEFTQAYRLQGKLPQITKEVMHTALSMTNNCEY